MAVPRRVLLRRLSADGIAGIFQPGIGRSIRRGGRGRERLSGSGSGGRGSRWGTRHRSRHSQRHRWHGDGQSPARGLPLRLSIIQRLLLREPLRLGSLRREPTPRADVHGLPCALVGFSLSRTWPGRLPTAACPAILKNHPAMQSTVTQGARQNAPVMRGTLLLPALNERDETSRGVKLLDRVFQSAGL
jgi:hypothetical protein